MREFLLRGQALDSVFELIGEDENSRTFAFGWCLSRVDSLLQAVADHLGEPVPSSDASILLQRHSGAHGITDVELQDPGRAAWVFEAKIGFDPPGTDQLVRYAARLNQVQDPGAAKLLVVIAHSDRGELWLQRAVPADVQGIPVKVLSWSQIVTCIDRARGGADNTGKGLLRQLRDYLIKVARMQDVRTNSVYVVSVSDDTFGGGPTSFIEVVTNFNRYFHPIEPRWPRNPPNYLAFRWGGRLQSVHHVDRYEIITQWSPHFPDTTEPEIKPHFLYHLGPAIHPHHEVRTGNLFRNGRVWAALDLLLTSQTISQARDLTQAREAAVI